MPIGRRAHPTRDALLTEFFARYAKQFGKPPKIWDLANWMEFSKALGELAASYSTANQVLLRKSEAIIDELTRLQSKRSPGRPRKKSKSAAHIGIAAKSVRGRPPSMETVLKRMKTAVIRQPGAPEKHDYANILIKFEALRDRMKPDCMRDGIRLTDIRVLEMWAGFLVDKKMLKRTDMKVWINEHRKIVSRARANARKSQKSKKIGN